MPYTPTVWVDNTTLVDAAKMNKIETGIASLSAPTPSTTPPASPADGDIWYYPLSTGGAWQFRYNASAATYKWEYVGGSSIYVSITTMESTTSTVGYQDLATVGPSFVVPRAGIYDAVASALGAHTVGGTAIYTGLAVAAGAVFEQTPLNVSPSNGWSAFAPLYHRSALAASNEIRVRYYNAAPGTASWWTRLLQVTPVAVS